MLICVQESVLAPKSEGAAMEAALTNVFHSLVELMAQLPVSSEGPRSEGATGEW